jgi:hypothetical protein
MSDWTFKVILNAMNAVEPKRPLTLEEEMRLAESLRIAQYVDDHERRYDPDVVDYRMMRREE